MLVLGVALAGLLTTIPADKSADAGFTVLLIVDTPTDAAASDGKCSIREAITAANDNTQEDTCNALLSQPGATDTITFNIGANPVINVTSPLPTITDSVLMNGNSGGATRVELRGPGGPYQANFHGLWIAGDNATVRNMVINSFPDTGITAGSESFTLKASYIGVLADGMTAAPNNGFGLVIGGTHARIGGASGTTPSGPCTGDCNVISANVGSGIYTFAQGSDAVIQGNFIGLDSSGTQARGNGNNGISIGVPGAMVGGTSPSARNVIFADDGWAGIDIGADSTTVQGNLLGTDSTGSSLPSGFSQQGGFGILINSPGSVIGGGLPGAGNVISGFANGIHLLGTDANNTQVRKNLIGTAIDGMTPIPNSRGIVIQTAGSNVIGGPEEGNVIANSSVYGVVVDGGDGNVIRGNSIHSNGVKGILLFQGGNMDLPPPVITGFGSVHGTACPGCTIDVYSDDEDEGRTYEGTTAADGSGAWTFNGTPAGPFVTATATDAGGNTSEFSAPVAVTSPTPTPSSTTSPTATPAVTPTPTPTSPGGSPTPTPTPTPTATPSSTPAELRQGDNDCDGDSDAIDALVSLQSTAALPYNQEPDCLELGVALPAGAEAQIFGDIDCDGDIDAIDALQILRNVAGLPVNQEEACPQIGEAL